MGFGSDIRVAGNDLTHRQIKEECARLAGQLWEDRRFPAQDPRTLYGPDGLPSGKPYGGGGAVRWLRPHEVKGASKEGLGLVHDGADAGDVIQGELGDCYLLGAMSSIAAKGLLPKLLKEGDPMESIRRGFMTFMLYKFGEWVEVSIDTLLPCNEEGECLFAHGKDPNELWVPLLEKAYAKLHGSFEALDGGSVTAALVDLTGGVGEAIDLQVSSAAHPAPISTDADSHPRICRSLTLRTSHAAGRGHYLRDGGRLAVEAAEADDGPLLLAGRGVLQGRGRRQRRARLDAGHRPWHTGQPRVLGDPGRRSNSFGSFTHLLVHSFTHPPRVCRWPRWARLTRRSSG
jgi:hypothetical protein